MGVLYDRKKIPLIIAILVCAAIPLSAEYLFLTDGSIIQGRVIRESAAGVFFRSNDSKKNAVYPISQVMRVHYAELNMSRLYIQLKDGESMRAFMVDEDHTSYVLRKELNDPTEFRLERSKVLFMAERNPSGLKGTAGYTDIRLKWLPSYDVMEHYNIYVKTGSAEEFSLAAKASGKTHRLEGLKGNTQYFIAVTGVDNKNEESTRSNILQIATLNTPPGAPSGVRVVKEKSGVVVEWRPAVDSDGTVDKYRVFIMKDEKRSLFGETKEKRIVIDKKPADIHRVQVTAIDNNGAESAFADRRAFQPYIFRLAFTPALIVPFGKFADMGSTGYGGLVSMVCDGIIFDNAVVGIEAGYMRLPGVDSLDSAGQKVDGINFAPFGVKAGYKCPIGKSLYVWPSVTAGAAYIGMNYINRDRSTGVDTDKTKSGLDAMALVSLNAGWNISKNLFLGINGGYGMLFEKDAVLRFAVTGMEMGWRF